MWQSKIQFESLLGWRYIAFYHEGCVGVGCNNHPGVGCNSVTANSPLLQLTPPCYNKPWQYGICYYESTALILILRELMLDEFTYLLACAIKAEHLKHIF